MHKFDYSFLADYRAKPELLSYVSVISGVKERASLLEGKEPKLFSEMSKIAILQSVKSSNEIEGIVTSDPRIKAIVTENVAPLNHNEWEIAGYRDALNEIHSSWKDIPFDERSVLGLHRVLLSHTGSPYGGAYKKEDNIIQATYADGRREVRWVPTPAKDTQEAMSQLFLAFQDASGDDRIEPLLLMPCAILDFLCVHPFSDGNGRMSRLLSVLLLYKSGYSIPKYVSFEEQINRNKAYYCEALQRSSKGWHENASDYSPFIENFIYTLFLSYQELSKRLSTLKTGRGSKAKRVEEAVLSSFAPISKAEIASLLPDVSKTTIEAVLGRLVKEGKIVRVGMGPFTRYRAK